MCPPSFHKLLYKLLTRFKLCPPIIKSSLRLWNYNTVQTATLYLKVCAAQKIFVQKYHRDGDEPVWGGGTSLSSQPISYPRSQALSSFPSLAVCVGRAWERGYPSLTLVRRVQQMLLVFTVHSLFAALKLHQQSQNGSDWSETMAQNIS